jgi:hypothetical protein
MGLLKRIATVSLAIAVVVAVACVDMSAPKGPAAISLLQLPALYVVLGDTMRDTNGVAGPPSVITFDAAGTPSTAADAQFFTTDSAPVATFSSKGQLVGKTLGIVHLIGQIGRLQTPAVPVTVTAAPDSLAYTVPTGLTLDTLIAAPSTDSAASVGTLAINVTVLAADQTTVPGVLVTYTLAPHSTTQKYPALFLTDGTSPGQSIVDTTKAGGTSSRTLTAVAAALAPAVRIGGPDTAFVTVTAKYKGAPLKNSPLKLAIPIKAAFPTG